MIDRMSLRMSLTVGIAIMGFLGVILALYVDATYRRVALEHQRYALEEIIRLRVGDLLEDLVNYSRDLGQAVQNNGQFRKDLKARNADAVKRYLSLHFHQYFVTAGILKLNSLIAHDQQLHVVAIAVNDNKNADTRGGEPCQSLHDKAKLRHGVDRLKVISQLCMTDGYPFMHALIPIGGLHLLGYLEVITDPTYTITQIEQDLGMPLRIAFTDRSKAFESKRWPKGPLPEHSMLANYIPHTPAGQDAFILSFIQDISEFEQQLKQTRIGLMLTVAIVTCIVSLLMLLFIKKTTVDPMQSLASHLRKIRHNSQYLGSTIKLQGNKEVQTLASGFNEMTVELKMLYDELQHANDDLKAEIQEREKAEVQLMMSRNHLEDLVEQRTADLAVARDAAIQASQSKSQFLANMSHELRTPLNAIIGYTEMLLEDAEDNEDTAMSHDLEKVHSAASHLLILIKDILDLTKIEAGKIELELSNIDVAHLIKDMQHTIQPVIAVNNNEFVVECPDDVGIIYADAVKLHQALLNLLSNAAKFTTNGKVCLQVKRYSEHEAEKIMFAVTDNGIGLSKKEASRIFEAFTQADSSTTRKYGGTGLGLAISRNFCQLMGGDLVVRSEKGRGSTFSIVIPVKVRNITHSDQSQEKQDDYPDARQQRLNNSNDRQSERRSHVSSILFVNEEAILARQFARYFELKGFSSQSASDAESCMYFIGQQYFDVIVLDLELANAGDWRLMRFIQGHPNLRNTSIILLGERQYADQGFALGAIECLPVPTDKSLLQAAINKCVRREAFQSEARVRQ